MPSTPNTSPKPERRWLRNIVAAVATVGAFAVFAKFSYDVDGVGNDDARPTANCNIEDWGTNARQFPMPDKLPFDIIMDHYPRITVACETKIEIELFERYPDAEPDDLITLPSSVEEKGLIFFDHAA